MIYKASIYKEFTKETQSIKTYFSVLVAMVSAYLCRNLRDTRQFAVVLFSQFFFLAQVCSNKNIKRLTTTLFVKECSFYKEYHKEYRRVDTTGTTVLKAHHSEKVFFPPLSLDVVLVPCHSHIWLAQLRFKKQLIFSNFIVIKLN